MKKLFIISAIAISGLSFNAANAQVRLGLGIGPVRAVYTTEPVEQAQASDADDYYYLPDVDAYYDVVDQCYLYFDGTEWVSAAYLPGAYRDYDWRSARRFEVREYRPYMRADFYRSRYNGRQFSEWGHRDYDNHSEGGYANQGYRDNDHRFDNRGDGGYNQREQQNRGNNERFNVWGQGGYNRPVQQNKENDHKFDNRGQGGNYQQSNQNNGRGRDVRGGNERVVQNNQQRGFDNHKKARF